MGEAKNRERNQTPFEREMTNLIRALSDQGKLIEAGWIALRLQAIPDDAPQVQIDEMRFAYMAGAQHLFASIMGVIEADSEPTANDMRRMELIGAEMNRFEEEVRLRLGRAAGSA